MLEPWNNASILPPPIHTFACEKNSFDIADLLFVCKEIPRVLTKQSPLHQEGALLSRFIYKFDKKFRNDIGFRHLKKVNTALRRYLSLNLLKDVENYCSVLPTSCSEEFYLPTRQMLEYLLVRLISFSKIMQRICVCSKQAAVFYLDRIKRGESYWMSLMPFAVLSRVWSICSVLLKHSCNWYSQMHSFLPKFQLKGLPFLPENYQLPSDLRQWMNIKDLDEFGRFDWSSNKRVEVIPILDEEEDAESFDIFRYANHVNEIPLEPEATAEVKSVNHGTNVTDIKLMNAQDMDQGQAISRDSYQKTTTLQSPCPLPKSHTVKNKANHCIENVTGNQTLKQFLDTEDKMRNDSPECALTNHLSFMQWQALKSNLLKLCDPLSKNRKIERKFQKIWKEKCDNYI
ncbi:uncharacterized protein LOC105383245 isoform X1 [Plutella xylostella]|uniref:uncharacterized protein LOC105383245 isoform X1 n=1 Tax=Plutella xylostella TaxID=51655 RepID=UPI002032C1C0|nr:uncharacterized protein LOC105383245 isoform X1 [Plutella xylostella]